MKFLKTNNLLILAAASVALVPFSAQAATFKDAVGIFISLINEILIPLILVLTFVVILFGIFRYFIAGATNEESRAKGRQLILWGAIALFLMFAVWGIVLIVKNVFFPSSYYVPGTITPTPSSATEEGRFSDSIRALWDW